MLAIDTLGDPTPEEALALGRAWFNSQRDPVGAQREVAALLEAAARRGQGRLADLSLAYEALAQATFLRDDPEAYRFADERLAALRDGGWQRAIWLAEVAVALAHGHDAVRRARALAWLRAQAAAEPDPRSITERAWADSVCAVLYALEGDFDAALAHGLRGDQLARKVDFAALQGLVAQRLSFVFLSVGDVEAAVPVTEWGLQAMRRAQLHADRTIYNQLLALVLDRRFADARALVEQLRGDGAFARRENPFGDVKALIRAECGETAEALQALDALPPVTSTVNPVLATNRAWMQARVMLRAGAAERAQALLQAFFAHLAQGGWPLSPMNGTELYRVQSEVCEALGDLRGSLDALKRSQACCFNWVASSVRARLQVLRPEHEQPAQAEARERRLAALGSALDRARADGDNAPGDASLQRQQRFLAQVTHEMRNPLAGVLGMTSLLMLSELDDRQRQYLQLAQSSAQMLLALCNDVLDLAKIDAGRFELNPQATDLAAMAHEAAAVFQPQLQARGVALRVQVDPALPPALWVDPLRVRQVLMNLLSNAAKFTRQGEVGIELRWLADAGLDAGAASGQLHLAVQDTGPGLGAGARARLFQEFTQADAGVAQAHGGTGLGLALCRSLVGLMGGRIDVDSTPGVGSRFWVELPLASAAPEPISLAAPAGP